MAQRHLRGNLNMPKDAAVAIEKNFTDIFSMAGFGDSVLPAANGGRGPLVDVLPATFGAVGNGTADDTVAIQAALTYASNYSGRVRLAAAATYKITGPLFAWGDCSIANADESQPGTLSFAMSVNYPYVINLGISAFKSGTVNSLQTAWKGEITGIVITVASSTGSGRLLYFWRTDGGKVQGNTFNLGASLYSATSSGNDEGYVYQSAINCVRRNLLIARNTVNATADSGGSEAIGLKNFDGADIIGNKVQGVGDDMVGIHYCRNIRVLGNHLRGVDGRVFIASSQNIEVGTNFVARMAQNGTGTWFAGSSLIEVGWEVVDSPAAGTYANDYINIHDNRLYYPTGSIDTGAGIYLKGPRNTLIKNNALRCDASGVTGRGLYVLPMTFTGSNWTDPDGVDAAGLTCKVGHTEIIGNTFDGLYPLIVYQSGSGGSYTGPVIVDGNTAPSYSMYGKGSYLYFGNRNEWTKATTTDASGTLTLVDQAEQSGQRFANVGAVGAWHYILPAAEVGLRFSFAKVVNQTMDVDTNGTDTINAGSAGGILTLTNVGSSITLECFQANKWIVTAANGAYTVA